MVDQRGTGGSHRLACPNRYVRRTNATAVTRYLRRCLARLDADPRLYTTSVAADDLEAVRRTLGYDTIDLFGVSYGATLAQAYARRYPDSVRSIVLDGGSLPNVRIYDVSARNAEHALDAQLARCAAAPACARAYPHPRKQLDDLLARPPRPFALGADKLLLSPDDIAWTVDWLSETAENAALIPFAVNTAAHGDYTPLATTYAYRLGGTDLEALARLVPFWVILCSEPWAAFDPAATARAGRGSYLAEAAVARARLFRRACAVVPKGRVPTDAAGRRVLPMPTLLLAGGADPLDPGANLRGWRRLFPRGHLVVVPGAGHGTLEYACVQTLIARFVEHPSRAPPRHLVCPARAAASVHHRLAPSTAGLRDVRSVRDRPRRARVRVGCRRGASRRSRAVARRAGDRRRAWDRQDDGVAGGRAARRGARAAVSSTARPTESEARLCVRRPGATCSRRSTTRSSRCCRRRSAARSTSRSCARTPAARRAADWSAPRSSRSCASWRAVVPSCSP